MVNIVALEKTVCDLFDFLAGRDPSMKGSEQHCEEKMTVEISDEVYETSPAATQKDDKPPDPLPARNIPMAKVLL